MIKPKLNLSIWFRRRFILKGYFELAIRGIIKYEQYIEYLELKLKDNNK